MTIPHEGNRDTYPNQVKSAFYFWAQNLAERTNGVYVAKDPNDPNLTADELEYMNLNRAYYEASDLGSSPEGHEYLKKLLHKMSLKLIQPGGFEEVIQLFASQPEMIERMRNMLAADEKLLGPDNIIVLTDHHGMSNSAVVQAALYCAVDRPGFAKHVITTTSKTLGFLDIFIGVGNSDSEAIGVPAIGALQSVGDVACSIPQTDSLDIPELEILGDFANGDDQKSGFNILMVRPYLRKAREANGLVSVMAASGSWDKPDRAAGTITMKSVGATTAELITRTASTAIAVSTYTDERGNFKAKIADIVPITNADDVHDAMLKIVPVYQDFVGDGLTVKYDDPRDHKMPAAVQPFDAAPQPPL